MTPEEFRAEFRAYAKGFNTGTRYKGRKRKTATPESQVKKACISLLWAWGCDVISTPTGAAFRDYTTKDGVHRRYTIRFGKEGLGDIVFLSPYGRWGEVETKSLKGKAREAQERRRREVERRGGVYVLAHSIEALKARKRDILATAAWT